MTEGLILGLVIGFYARSLRDLLIAIHRKLAAQLKQAKAKGDSGVVRNNRELVTVERGDRRYVKPIDPQGDSNIFRAPTPREVALQNEAERNNSNL